MKRNEEYKSIGEGSGKEAIDELKNEVLSPLKQDLAKLHDPFVLAAIMNTAATERENTNRLLKTIIEKLDVKFAELEERVVMLEEGKAAQQPTAPTSDEILLPSVDEEILRFVKEKRHVSAEEVRARFGYKGKNAASSRLNRMHDMGLLSKKQVGRAVLFFARDKV